MGGSRPQRPPLLGALPAGRASARVAGRPRSTERACQPPQPIAQEPGTRSAARTRSGITQDLLPLGLRQPAPDPVGLGHGQCVRAAGEPYRAGGADRLGRALEPGAFWAALPIMVEEPCCPQVAAGCLLLPLPVLGDGRRHARHVHGCTFPALCSARRRRGGDGAGGPHWHKIPYRLRRGECSPRGSSAPRVTGPSAGLQVPAQRLADELGDADVLLSGAQQQISLELGI